MATYQADPELMTAVGGALDVDADNVESWGLAAANTMYAHGYSYAATATAGTTYQTAEWGRAWANSLRSRASMLAAYHEIALLGASAAIGGAGAALAAGKQWAFSSESTVSFEDWYAAQMQLASERRQGADLAADLTAALENDDYGAAWEAIHALVALGSPAATASFFNALGANGTAALPNELIGMTSYGKVHLRASVGHPADLISLMSRRLAAASHSGELDFSGAELIEADLAADIFASRYLTGYGAEYLFLAGGFEPEFIAGAAAAYLPYAVDPLMAQDVLVSSYDGQLPLDARDFLLANVAEAGGGAALVLQLLEKENLEALLAPRYGVGEEGAEAIAAILEQATIDLFTTEPETAQWVIGTLVDFIAEHGSTGYSDVVAASVLLILPQLGGIMNGVSGEAYLGVPGGNETVVTDDELAAVFRAIAANDAATQALYEGLLSYYGGLLDESGGDPTELNRIAISLAGVSSLLTTSIADANIADAKERDERIAALIGLIDTLSGLVPMPGAKAVGSQLASRIIKTTYNELVDRGLELVQTNEEGAARIEADEFNDALLFTYTEFLTVGYLNTQGTEAIASSIDEFFAASPHLDRDLYDFSDGAGSLLANLTDRQSQAYGEWILFASATEEINNAISRLLAEFLRGLPHYE